MIYKKKRTLIDRIFNRTTISLTPEGLNDKQQCWIWQGATLNSGYGMVRISTTEGMELVHRTVYKHFNNNPITSSDEVQHICGNKLCLNPDHLILGNTKTRLQVKPKGFKHWLIVAKENSESLIKTCNKCGKSTHILWFSRKHKRCK